MFHTSEWHILKLYVDKEAKQNFKSPATQGKRTIADQRIKNEIVGKYIWKTWFFDRTFFLLISLGNYLTNEQFLPLKRHKIILNDTKN